MRRINLGPHERIVAVVCQRAAGPGWSNTPTCVHIINDITGMWRAEYIQPDERSPELHALYDAAEAMHRALIAAVPVTRAK